MTEKEYEILSTWVTSYYSKIKRKSTLNGVEFSYYKSLRGYFKHSILLTDIKQKEFGLADYKIWERMLTHIKSGRDPVESGGMFMSYSKFRDICSERSYYASKKKFLDLELILETPFSKYFILNPMYIIKLYNPSEDIE